MVRCSYQFAYSFLMPVLLLMNRRRHKMFKTSSGTTSVTSHCTVLNILWRHLLSIRVQTTETCMWFAFYYRPKSASGQGLQCGVNQTKKHAMFFLLFKLIHVPNKFLVWNISPFRESIVKTYIDFRKCVCCMTAHISLVRLCSDW